MFDKLTDDLQQEVTRIISLLGESNIEAIGKFANKSGVEATEYVRNLLAYVVDDDCCNADDVESEATHDTVANALMYYAEMTTKYIAASDELPVESLLDITRLTLLNSNDYWKELLTNNLSDIPKLARDIGNPKGVTTALFKAIVRTGFDFDMNY